MEKKTPIICYDLIINFVEIACDVNAVIVLKFCSENLLARAGLLSLVFIVSTTDAHCYALCRVPQTQGDFFYILHHF